jgi:hypothetical protein
MNRPSLLSGLLWLGAGALILNSAAWGQDYPPRNDPYYRNNDPYQQRGYGGNDYGRDQGYLIGRVMSDLNRAAASARLDGHERKHFDEVAQNLQDFQARWARGKFDTGKLDKAIHNLEHLADADRVRGRDRDMLARDLDDLRRFRASRGGYSGYGYRDYRDPYWR